MGELTYKSPLYIQLREVIRSKIEEEEYLPGTAIPSENQLMEQYGLNRQSVRSALAALEYEGLLKSVQGKGVFVAGPKTERDLETLGGYRTTMRQRDRTPSTKVLIKALRTAGPYYGRLLEIGAEEEIWFIRRVDSADQEAVALEGRRFSPLLTARLRDKRVTDRICQAFQEGRREAYRRMYERETNHVCDAGNGMN